MRTLILSSVLSIAIMAIGCDRKPETGTPATTPPAATEKHDDHDGHDHAAEEAAGRRAGHTGEAIELGTTKIGELAVRASRDKGDIKPGGDAPIDVWLTTADGKPATVTALRFWIGTEDAKGSIKAKADIEDPMQPNHWHTHVEFPDPLPADCKLWVQIEVTSGERLVTSFPLKL